MYYTYLISSKKDRRWYTGCTDDLRKRFKAHNTGQVSSTKGRGPFELMYYEACHNKNDAYAREKYLKTGMGKRYLKNRLKRFLALTGLIVVMGMYAHSSDAATISRPMQSLGLVGYWSFDVGKGGAKAVDMSGKGNNGTLTNMNTTAAWVGGKIGNALSFDGVNDFVEVSGPALTNLTMCAWVLSNNPDGTGNPDGLSNIVGGSGILYYASVYSSKFQVYDGGNWRSGTTIFSAGVWYYTCLTFQGATKELKLYTNGNLEYSASGWGTYSNGSISVLGRHTGAVRYLNGKLDEVRIYNRALSAEEIKRLYRQTSPQMNASQANKLRQGLVGMWTFDGNDMSGNTAIDRSGQGNNGTLTNGPTRQIGKIGQALNFDGSNDYVNAGNAASLANLTEDITATAWIKPMSLWKYNSIISKWTPWIFFVDSSNRLNWYVRYSGVDYSVSANTALSSTNTWYHAVVVYTRSDSKATFYLNGKLDGSSTRVMDNNTTSSVRMGYYGNSSAAFNGLIDEVRVYNRALTEAEIRQLYKAGSSFHPNVTNKSTIRDGLVGHWTFDGADMGTTSARDASGNANTGWLINGAKKTIGKIGQGMNFDGVDDNVSAVIGSVPSATFTISAWIKLNELGREQHAAEFTGTQFYVASNNKLGTGNWGNAAGSTALTKGQWYHIVITRNSSQLLLFLNGSQDGSGSVLTNEPSSPFVIGRFYGAGNYWFNGLIDEVRVYNRALTQAEIKRLYNMGR